VTIHQTVEAEKLTFLRNTIKNTIDADQISHHEASIISRIIRDISGREADFLMQSNYNNEKYNSICLNLQAPPPKSTATKRGDKSITAFTIKFTPRIYVADGVLHVSDDTKEAELVDGLITLGLLIPSKIVPV
jgi:hypothetical protein